MDLSDLYLALSNNPEQLLRGILRIVHFFGLAVGFGAAILLDLMVLRFFLFRQMTQHSIQIFEFCTEVVSNGLKLLWVSGIGFLVFYWLHDPVKLGNEKVWAKVVIVVILTLNGWVIHRKVLPQVYRQAGRSILQDIPRKRQHMMISSGCVSIISWTLPLVIANLSPLNFQVPMMQIIAVYVMILVCVLAAVNASLFISFRALDLRRRLER